MLWFYNCTWKKCYFQYFSLAYFITLNKVVLNGERIKVIYYLLLKNENSLGGQIKYI